MLKYITTTQNWQPNIAAGWTIAAWGPGELTRGGLGYAPEMDSAGLTELLNHAKQSRSRAIVLDCETMFDVGTIKRFSAEADAFLGDIVRVLKTQMPAMPIVCYGVWPGFDGTLNAGPFADAVFDTSPPTATDPATAQAQADERRQRQMDVVSVINRQWDTWMSRCDAILIDGVFGDDFNDDSTFARASAQLSLVRTWCGAKSVIVWTQGTRNIAGFPAVDAASVQKYLMPLITQTQGVGYFAPTGAADMALPMFGALSKL